MFGAVEAFLGRLWVRIALVAGSLAWQFFMVTNRLAESNHFSDEPLYAQVGWSYLHGRFDQNLEHPPTGKYLIGLAQLWWGQGIASGRIIAAIFVLVAAVVLGLLVATEAGFWGGLVAANLFVVMPLQQQNFAASAMLEPFMVSFLVFALAAAWAWHRTGAWPLLWVSGAFFALSVSSKVSAAVAAVAFVVVLFNKHRWWQKVLGVAGFVAAFWASLQWVYSQVGFDKAINYMLTFQGHHNEVGHQVAVDGVSYVHPPWWATAWFMFHEAGATVVIGMIVLAIVAFTWRPSALTVFFGLALAAMLVFYLGASRISLAHYYLGFFWLLAAIAGIGFARLARWASQSAPLFYKPRVGPAGTRKMARTALIGVTLVLALALADATLMVRDNRPYGLALVTKTMKHEHLWGRVFIVGEHNNLPDYLPGHWGNDAKHSPYAAIYVGTDIRYPMPAKIAEYIKQNKATLKKIDLRRGTYLLVSSVPIEY